MKAAYSILVVLLISATTAFGQVPDISSVPANFDYGSVFVTQSQDFAFAITNVGTGDLTINTTEIQGVDADQFRIIGGGGGRILAPTGTVLINVRFEPTSLGIKTASLRISSDDPDENPFDVPITGTAAGLPDISSVPANFDYGSVFVTQRQDFAFAITNVGTADLTINATEIQGVDSDQFRIIGGGGGRILVPTATVLVSVRFEPTSLGIKNASLRISSDDPDENPFDVPITGTAAGLPEISVNRTTMPFGDVRVGTTSQQEVIVSNTGLANLLVTGTGFTGIDPTLFVLAENNFPITITPQGRDTIRVNFTPLSGGNKSATLVVSNTDLDENPVNILLSGRGVRPDIAADLLNFNFNGVAVGDNESQVFTISNEGTGVLRIISTEIQGNDPDEFQIIGGGGLATINPGAQRLITIRFSPGSLGPKGAFLRIEHDDPDENPLIISFLGTGLGLPNIATSTTVLAFGDVRVGITRLRELIVTNTGLADLTVNSVSFTGVDPSLFELTETNLPFTLAPLERDTIRVNFLPPSGGDKSATLLISSTDPDDDPRNILLTGRGVRPDIASDTPNHDFGEIAVGENESVIITLSNEGLGSLLITETEILGTDSDDFQIIGGGGRATIGPGNQRFLTVRFNPSSLGQKEAFLRIVNDDPDENPFDIPLSGFGTGLPELTLNRTIVPFNNVRVGETRVEDIIVVNVGLANLVISSGEITGPDSDLFVLEENIIPFTLAPTERDTVRVHFTPLSGGNKSASLFLFNNDPDENPTGVLLTGEGVSPELSIDRNSHDFKGVAAGTTSEIDFTITNRGTGNLIIAEPELKGPDNSNFRISEGGTAVTLVPDATRILNIVFSPLTEGPKNATLVVQSDDLVQPVLELALSGTGTTIVIDAPASVTAGQAVSFTVTLPQEFQPTEGEFFYRLAGTPNYLPAIISVIGSAFQASIPGSAATLSGIEYYAVASNDDATITIPLLNPQTEPNFLPVRVEDLVSPDSLDTWVYRMTSVPLVLDDPSIAAVLSDDYGVYNTRRWRLFRWENGDYVEYPNIHATFEPGVAFFLITNDALTFTVSAGESVDPATSLTITLEPGWNQIGNPFAFPIAWPAAFIDPGIEAPQWFNGGEFIPNQSTLIPWEGYFVYNSGSADVTIPLSLRGPFGGLGKGAGHSNTTSQIQQSDYTIQLSAVVDGTPYRDTQNFIGLRADALDERDATDFAEAPPIGDFIRLSIIDNDIRYAGNFKSPSGEGYSWDLELDGTIPIADVAISISESGQRPTGASIYVLDLDNRNAFHLENDVFHLESPALGSVRHLRILLGPQTYAKAHADEIPLVPLSYQLEQNYPNPFNPETLIRYQLSQRSLVQIEIYDLLGRRVKTLVDSERDTGVHEIRWDGRNESGLLMASGLYIYRLRAGKFESSKKMLLIR